MRPSAAFSSSRQRCIHSRFSAGRTACSAGHWKRSTASGRNIRHGVPPSSKSKMESKPPSDISSLAVPATIPDARRKSACSSSESAVSESGPNADCHTSGGPYGRRACSRHFHANRSCSIRPPPPLSFPQKRIGSSVCFCYFSTICHLLQFLNKIFLVASFFCSNFAPCTTRNKGDAPMGKLEPGERKPQAERGLQSAKLSVGRGKRRPVSAASHRYCYKRAMDFMDNFMQICFT